MKISACMIVKNEEKTIGKCLSSLCRSVDEIVVVDTGSLDHTIPVAKQYGAKVFHYPWKADFAAAKNFALSKAKGDWVVFLDADEYFSSTTAQNIKMIVLKYGSQCDAFAIRMINIDVDQQNKVLEYFFPLRLFRRTPLLRYEGKVHESLVRNDQRPLRIYRIAPAILELYHTGYSSGVIEKKCHRNLPILLERLSRYPHEASTHAYLMDCYFNLKQYAKAIEYAQSTFSLDTSDLEYQSRIYRRWVKSLQYENKPSEEIEEVIQKAIEAFGDMADFYCEYALFFIENGNYDRALENLEIADVKERTYQGNEPSFYKFTYLVKEKLQAALYAARHDYDEAAAHYASILKENKLNEGIFQEAYLILKRMEPLQTIDFLNHFYDLHSQEDLNFLIYNIGKYTKNKVLTYYIHARKKIEQKSADLVLGLCCVKKYEAAAVQLYESLSCAEEPERVLQGHADRKILFAACLIAMEQKPPLACMLYLTREQQDVMECFYNEEKILSAVSMQSYLEIGRVLCSLEDVNLGRYFSLSFNLSVEFMAAVGEILIEQARFETAAWFFTNLYHKCDTRYAYTALEKAAYANYQNGNYSQAREQYEILLAENKAEDIAARQYYEWSRRKE